MYRIDSTVLSESLVGTTKFRRMSPIELVEITIVERLTIIPCTSSSSDSTSIEKRLDFSQHDEQFVIVFAWQFLVVLDCPTSQFNDSLFFAFVLCKMTCWTQRFGTTRSYVHCLRLSLTISSLVQHMKNLLRLPNRNILCTERLLTKKLRIVYFFIVKHPIDILLIFFLSSRFIVDSTEYHVTVLFLWTWRWVNSSSTFCVFPSSPPLLDFTSKWYVQTYNLYSELQYIFFLSLSLLYKSSVSVISAQWDRTLQTHARYVFKTTVCMFDDDDDDDDKPCLLVHFFFLSFALVRSFSCLTFWLCVSVWNLFKKIQGRSN